MGLAKFGLVGYGKRLGLTSVDTHVTVDFCAGWNCPHVIETFLAQCCSTDHRASLVVPGPAKTEMIRTLPLLSAKVNKHGLSRLTSPLLTWSPTSAFHQKSRFSFYSSAERMSLSGDATVPATRRVRKSIGASAELRKAADKENATVDVDASLAARRKKSRSKSLGPGGLDALKSGTGNRRASLAVPSKAPRSILKPTIALLPEIPPLKKNSKVENGAGNKTISSLEVESNGSKIALRTEEEQQAAAREREERERRDARRKSLMNRRVSFAAEATLHTFHEVDFMQDSTTSTEASRRASSAAGKPPAHDAAATGRQSTPQDHVKHEADYPENQRGLHQRNSRRASSAYSDRDDDTIASTIYSSDSEPADAVEEVEPEEDEGSSSDSDDGTMMSMVTEEVTGTSIASDQSLASVEDSSTIDEVLRLAARRAATQQLDEDSDEDLDDGEEVIPSFGWAKKGASQSTQQPSQGRIPSAAAQTSNDDSEETAMDMDTDMDMEMTHAVGKILKPAAQHTPPDDIDDETGMDMDMDMDLTQAPGRILKPAANKEQNQDDDMSMDVTRAIGGILSNGSALQQSESRDEPSMDEVTMEFTTAIGGIHRTADAMSDHSEDNEDMSMEFTHIMGGLLSQQAKSNQAPSRRATINRKQTADSNDMTMDMTVGIGRIINGADQDTASDEDDETAIGMDITTAIGGILGNGATSSRSLGKQIMEDEVNRPDSDNKAALAVAAQALTPKARSPLPTSRSPSKSQSPSLSTSQDRLSRHRLASQRDRNPVAENGRRTPSPNKPSTPRSVRSSPRKCVLDKTPSKSPVRPLRASTSRTPSPIKSPAKQLNSGSVSKPVSITPTIVLTPQKRQLSGFGADREGLGSPKVAALFDRRSSIGDTASDFVPGKRNVAFEDPQVISLEVDRDRQDEEEKENQRKILEREVDAPQEDRDATLNLREMINSLSPKRKPLKSRKSLHVGSARGVLGKRPAELDDEDETDDNDGVKRLKGHQSSPVKNVRLQQPPSKEETAGRPLKFASRTLEHRADVSTPSFSSPMKQSSATTPRDQGRFRDATDNHTVHEVNFHDSPVKDEAQLLNEVAEDQVHLQDFLNMTSIRFMELNTTKRRHTAAPGSFQDGTSADGKDDLSLERCVVAGACTVPMLELYQHSCRELKKYISEGRRMVKEIETDTFEENPPLFREYMSATPEVKALMDNQFKNVKTHARLLSKAMWYEWRMKLQDGLKEGLVKIAEGMEMDDEALHQQQELLSSVIPSISNRFEVLEEEAQNLEEVAQELADCDPSELEAAREELISLSDDVEQKKKLIAQLRQQLEESEEHVEELTAEKQQCLGEIKESEQIREECRGWTSKEINALKGRIEKLEKQHGWVVTGISGSTISMAYKREIELVFDVASFQPQRPNSQIDLWYLADGREHGAIPKTVEKEFFLQCIRDHIRALSQSSTKVPEFLRQVSSAWDQANHTCAQIERMNIAFRTKTTKTSDNSISVKSSLLLVPLETKVEVTLRLQAGSRSGGIAVSISPEATVVYGERFNTGKMGEFLATRMGGNIGATEEDWSNIVAELHDALIARGRK
ncbi:chromosome segregation protein [Paramyrothecium foliicola]|nr:chromosome segregation protein [Paramyrothecium foliicola]